MFDDNYLALNTVHKFDNIRANSENMKRGVRMRSQGLTGRQRQILDYLIHKAREKGYAPSVREIAAALGLRSPSTVHQHLTALEQKGHIHRNGERMRAVEVVDKALLRGRDAVMLPLVGRVSAGSPSLADEQVEEHVAVPRGILGDVAGCFLLRVRGDSMNGAGIMPDDVVVVRRQFVARPGDIVVALLGEDATVKRLVLDEGTPVLMPANPSYAPIRKEFQVIGRVVGLLRAYQGGRECV